MMCSDLLTKWLSFFKPLALGQFGNARANGMALSCGQFWVRARGGYNLYRWCGDRYTAEPGRIVGAAGGDLASVATFPYVGHDPGTRYWYLVRAVGAGGVSEMNCRQVVRVELDEAGELVGPQPNSPESLATSASSGGRIELGWRYNPAGQEAAPVAFDVFGDGGTGSMAWETPIDSVEYRVGMVDYSWISEPFAHDTRAQFAVRARSGAGVRERNERTAMAWARSLGPEPLACVVAEPGTERR
jgi:hypothetical protein